MARTIKSLDPWIPINESKKPPTDTEKERAYKSLYTQVTMFSMGRETTIGTRLEMARKELAEKRQLAV